MVSKQKILVVEDEQAIRNGLVDVLVFHGFDVESSGDGNDGLKLALSGKFDLVLLDVMLPGLDGFEICNQVRQADREQAIIMLTAKTSDEDIIQGLQLGADDYVSKPFSVAQLVLRIQAVLRRSNHTIANEGILSLAQGVNIDTLNMKGTCAERETVFTRREMDVLQYLASHAERPVSREELLNKIWGYDKNIDLETRTVDIHIAKIRRKIEPEPGNPVNLVTVRGAGYRLMVDSNAS